MDGNKRWAKKKNISIKDGYLKGLYNIETIINFCIENNINNLTLYALSTENFKRKSVNLIFRIILKEYLKILSKINKDNYIKINFIGDRKKLPKNLINIFNKVENITKKNNILNLKIAFNYGTDQEIREIINNIIELNIKKITDKNSNLIKSFMYLKDMPDPDILIRTGGFQRLSNFLLLNLSYTELFFTKTLWPDFSLNELNEIVNKFKKIKRNYGL